MKQAVIILSGGMDSATLLYFLLKQGYQLDAISFDYGQRHSKELLKAKHLCEINKIPHTLVDLFNIRSLLKGSALTDDIKIPEGHYEEESMKLTVVPNRNMIMLSLALGYAISHKIKHLAYGAHAGDHAIYPDCRKEFLESFKDTARLADWYQVEVIAPFQSMDKGDIACIGRDLRVPYEHTWTCYKGLDKACGKCGACQERLEAFEKAGVTDPLEYTND